MRRWTNFEYFSAPSRWRLQLSQACYRQQWWSWVSSRWPMRWWLRWLCSRLGILCLWLSPVPASLSRWKHRFDCRWQTMHCHWGVRRTPRPSRWDCSHCPRDNPFSGFVSRNGRRRWWWQRSSLNYNYYWLWWLLIVNVKLSLIYPLFCSLTVAPRALNSLPLVVYINDSGNYLELLLSFTFD